MRYNWKILNNQQIGAYGEYFVKMEMTMLGIQVYSTEVDDRGIDFVARYEKGPFFSIQVKSVFKADYVYMRKEKFELSSDLYLALVVLVDGIEPTLFLIPSEEWNNPQKPLVEHNYEERKSEPEWGLNLSKKNIELLERYSFSEMIAGLKNNK